MCELTTLLCTIDDLANITAKIEAFQIDCTAPCVLVATGTELALGIIDHGASHTVTEITVDVICPSALLRVRLRREHILHEGCRVDHIDWSGDMAAHRCRSGDGESGKEQRGAHHLASGLDFENFAGRLWKKSKIKHAR